MLAYLASAGRAGPRALGHDLKAPFAATAATYIVTRHVPLGDAFGLAEIVTGVSLATIFMIILTSVISIWIHDDLGDLTLAKRLDISSHLVFLVGYVGLNVAVARAAYL